LKKILTYITLLTFLNAAVPVQALAQGIGSAAVGIERQITQERKKEAKKPVVFAEMDKEKEREELTVPVRVSEVTMYGDNADNFFYGNSVYYNLLKKADRLDLLGKSVEEIDDILSEKAPTPDGEEEGKQERQEKQGKEDSSEKKDSNGQQGDKIKNKRSHDLPVIGPAMPSSAEDEESDRFIVKYKDDAGRAAVAAALGEEIAAVKRKKNHDVIIIKNKVTKDGLINSIAAKNGGENIEYIQPDKKVRLSSLDTYFDLQWGLSNPGSVVADADFVSAWSESTGAGVVVAVIDSGLDTTHEDLQANVWQNPGEIPDNGLDDDGNGYIDDICGWNFSADNNSVHNPASTDEEVHGTNVAGIIAAIADNNAGIAGAAPQARIMPLKVFANGTAYTSDIIEAIEYAQAVGVKIVNCSFGASGENQALHEAMSGKDMLFICAAGNGSADIDVSPLSPASFALDNIVSVASLDDSGFLSTFSNYGANSVDVAAPGEDIITTSSGNCYVSGSGTSLATAFVSGEAALLLGKNSALSVAELKSEILLSSEHLSSLFEKTALGNKINARNALLAIHPAAEEIIQVEGEPGGEPGGTTPPTPEPTGDGEFFELYSLSGDEKAWYNNLVGPSSINGMNESKYSAWENLQEIIAPQTGDLTLKQTDIHLPGRNGLDLEIGRIYQSGQSLFGDRQAAGDGTSYSDYSTYYLNRYSLGTGWAFNFPSVQVEEDEGQTELYYHTGSGPKYHVEFTTDPSDSNLEDYYKKDVVFNEDTSFNNGQVQSRYALTTSDKSKRYFAADGRLLAITDRFDNQIVFSHTEKPVANQAPNNDFEFSETQGMWTASGSYSYDQTTGKDDTTSLKFYSASAVTNSSLSAYLPVTPNTKYYLGGYIKNLLSAGTTGLTYKQYSEIGTEIGPGTLITAAGGGAWELCEQEFTTAANAKYIRIEFKQTSAVGTANLDKVRFDRAWPLISEITDSIGRTVTFSYTDTLYDENAANAGTITVTVEDPAEANSYSFSYTKSQWLVNYSWPSWSEQRRYAALHLVDNGDKDTVYDYTEFDEKFSYTSKTTGGTYQNSKRPLLSQMTLRNSRVIYQYDGTTKHLGENGFYETHRIVNRYEQQETGTGYTAGEDNKQSFTYSGAYGATDYDNETGYPGLYTLFENPAFSFTASMQQTNGLRVDTTYHGQYEYKIEKFHSNGEKEATINETCDTRFPELPTKIRLDKSNTGSETTTLYTGKSYTDWGGLASETRGLTQAQWEDTYYRNKHTIYFTYDPEYRFLTAKTYYQSNSKQLTESTVYDSLGRKISGTNPKGEVSEYRYEDANYPGNLTTLILHHGGGIETKKTYDYTGAYNAWATTITEYYTKDGVPATSQTQQTYEFIRGNILTSTDALGHVTSYTYDSQGRLTKVAHPSAQGEAGLYVVEDNIVYDGSYVFAEYNNRVVFKLYTYKTKTVGGGSPETYAQTNTFYDDHGSVLLSQVYDTERSVYLNTTYAYNSYGQMTSAADAYDTQTNYTIDEWGRLQYVTDAEGNRQVVEYDPYNRTKNVYFLPFGGTAENQYTEEYDQWGRIIARKGYPDGIANPAIQETYEYDLTGNLTKVTDARGNSSTFSYDQMNRLVKVINPLGEVVDVAYNRLGNLSQIQQYEGGNTFTITKLYDERGLLISQQPPLGNPSTFAYNALGLPVETTDPQGKTATLQYDNSNNLIEKIIGQDKINYYYNPLGGIGTYEVWDGLTPKESLSYDYTSTGLTKERTAGTHTVSFQYDLTGKMTQMTDPFGYAAAFDYDDLYRLETITAGGKTFEYEYYPDGMISAVNYPALDGSGTLRTQFTYDNLNRLTDLQNILNSQVISRYEYTYDNNGNVTQIIENATLTSNYQYDALNRLTAIERSTGESVNYQYDTRGNRIQTAGITLDETDFIPGEFTYNNWEELTSFAIDGGDTYTYQYDAEGLRTYKTGPSSTTKYHYDLSGRVIAESNGAGNVTAQNIWGHKMLARKIGAAYYYYLYNGHGDVVQIVNESGAIVNSYNYDEWGNIRTISETVSNPLRYCGEYFDEESGLYYLRARYYDPLIARFITKDSLEGDISNPLSMNQYTYCYNNPLIYADPSGHLVDQAGLQQMFDRGEIDNYTITYVPGVGETTTITQNGSTLTITDNTANEYFDYTDRIQDLMGFGNSNPAANASSSDSGSSDGGGRNDTVSSMAAPTSAGGETDQAKAKVISPVVGTRLAIHEMNNNKNTNINTDQFIDNVKAYAKAVWNTAIDPQNKRSVNQAILILTMTPVLITANLIVEDLLLNVHGGNTMIKIISATSFTVAVCEGYLLYDIKNRLEDSFRRYLKMFIEQ